MFLKGPNSVAGHRSATPRPADVKFMHYECELAVVIGRTTRNAGERGARACRGLHGRQRLCRARLSRELLPPEPACKEPRRRDAAWPWLIDADDIGDPANLELRTTVNGQVTQRGNTRDMILGVDRLIEYLSSSRHWTRET